MSFIDADADCQPLTMYDEFCIFGAWAGGTLIAFALVGFVAGVATGLFS